MSNYCTMPIKTKVFCKEDIILEFEIRYNLVKSIKQIKREIRDKLQNLYAFRKILIDNNMLSYQLTFDDIVIKADNSELSHDRLCYEYPFYDFTNLNVFIGLPEKKKN